MVKNLPANVGDVGSVPKSGRSPGEEMVTHSSILIWEIQWTKEPGGLQSIGLPENGMQLSRDTQQYR